MKPTAASKPVYLQCFRWCIPLNPLRMLSLGYDRHTRSCAHLQITLCTHIYKHTHLLYTQTQTHTHHLQLQAPFPRAPTLRCHATHARAAAPLWPCAELALQQNHLQQRNPHPPKHPPRLTPDPLCMWPRCPPLWWLQICWGQMLVLKETKGRRQ